MEKEMDLEFGELQISVHSEVSCCDLRLARGKYNPCFHVRMPGPNLQNLDKPIHTRVLTMHTLYLYRYRLYFSDNSVVQVIKLFVFSSLFL